MTRIALLFVLLFCLSVTGGCDSERCADVTCGRNAACDPLDGLCRCSATGSATGSAGLDSSACDASDACDTQSGQCVPSMPIAVCSTGATWAPGMTAFVDATAAFGLTGVEGVRMTVTDIDGDGYPDLEVRRGGVVADTPEARQFWLLRNTGGGSFEDVTESSNILVRRRPASSSATGPGNRPVQVVAWGDVDNDGDLDMYSGLSTNDLEASGEETSELLLNDGRGQFTLADAAVIRRADAIDMPAGATFVDVDHDGNLDLFVAQHNYSGSSGRLYLQNDRLFRNMGAAGFVDATTDAGLTTMDWLSNEALNDGLSHTRAWSSNACDLNGDGFQELIVASYGRSPNHLWQSTGPMMFTNRSVASGYAYDDDQTWQNDQFARCFCQSDPTAVGCMGVPAPSIGCGSLNWNHATGREPWRLGGNSGATICGDIDNDGDLDLFTGEIRHWWAGSGADGSELLLNDGGSDAVFTRPGDDALGLAIPHAPGTAWDEGHMTSALLDFDNDGRLDIYVGASDYAGNRGRLYHQQDGVTFSEVDPGEGIDHNRSHGVVFADFDRDGDLDVVVGHSRARCDSSLPNNCYATSQVRLFENVTPTGNFVQIELDGAAGTNRAAIGARVRVSSNGVTQTQEIGGGHGHYGAQNDRVLHFGLGAGCDAALEVRWPDGAGTTETFSLVAGYRFYIAQGQEPLVRGVR